MANPCGHEWVVSITQQEEEPDLDQALLRAISELAEIDAFAIYVNKHFNDDVAPILLNKDSPLGALENHEISSILQKVSKNKIRISAAFGSYTSYIPMYYLGRVIGMLLVEKDHELAERTTMLSIHILNVYANQLALIHRSRLDPLTELLNRQTFDTKVIEIVSDDEFSLSNDAQSWFLAIVDIDHFKRVNDNFGHVIGDEVILLLARLLKNNFKVDDFVFRYGGEEFAVLFNAKSDSDALHILECFRNNVAEYPFPQVGQLTVSIGYLKLTEVDMVASLVNKADLALYHSKNNGRDQVTSYLDLNLVEKVQNDDDGIELF